jgi:carbon monoxide dehydrogenase subunit G
MRDAELTVRVDVAAPQEVVWRVLTDWERQREWMVGTTVTVTDRDGHSVGSGLAAFTGLGRLGFTDTMRITTWDPPRRCEVRHTGRLVRGFGVFDVEPQGDAASVVAWTELLDLPLGPLGRLSWPVVRPAARVGLAVSLRRLAKLCER